RIIDPGKDVSIADIRRDPETPDLVNYRRRDLSMVPIIDTSEGKPESEAVALAGVFTETNGIFTVPVEIDGAGEPAQADPALKSRSEEHTSELQSRFDLV